MKIVSLKVNNFRNYNNLNLTFSPRLNIIYGKNGSGKTNLVEAIYTLALTKSFRTGDDKLLIRKNEVSCKIEGKIKTNYQNLYQVIINNEGKKVKINNKQESRISDYISNINIILFQPDDQMLLKLSPAVRRKMLNIEISQLKKEYIINLNYYNKLLKQRNFHLRYLMLNSNTDFEYLNILTKKLVYYGYKVYEERQKFVEMINNNISNIYSSIFSDHDLFVKYKSDYSTKNIEDVYKLYEKNYNREINMGKTLLGIQHDDIDFIIDGNDMKEWSSVGEQKNAILSFKLAEMVIFKEIKGYNPILILDDIFSELDKTKVKNIINLLDRDIQTFITTTEVERISKKLSSNAKLIKIKNGIIEEEINNERKSL